MSSNSSTPTSTSEQDASSAQPSFANKIQQFIQHNPTWVYVGAAFLLILIVFLILYFSFIRASRMERFADQFCTCTEQVERDFYNESKDGFAYHSQLVPCFAEDFSPYGDGFTKAEKRILLEEFQQAVIEKCPDRLNGVLHYEMR